MFEVRNLSFSHGSRQILRDLSFVVSPGETLGVVGTNGTGKTTLVRLLATLAVPDSGQVLFDGQDAFRHLMRYRRQIGYLGERIALEEDMTVKAYLRHRAALKGEPPKRVRRRVDEAVALCRLAPHLRTPILRLSYGMKKRVALADAILLRPRVLLLDDFLTGLDFEMRAEAGALLAEAASFSSVIVTGHELEDLAHWTTRFLVLRPGGVAGVLDTAGADAGDVRQRIARVGEGEPA